MEKESLFKTLTGEHLNGLNTKNLLAYYKAERKRFFKTKSQYICDCCGECSWDLYPKDYTFEKEQFGKWNLYLENIKKILSKREHVNVRMDKHQNRATTYRRRICCKNN